MNDKDKQELLIAISGYLPYGLKLDILVRDNPNIHSIDQVRYDNVSTYERLIKNEDSKFDIKPYLRPLSSMTEDEEKEVSILLNYEFFIDDDYALVAEDDRHRIRLDLIQVYINWLNSHHFDYRTDEDGKTMIERGLAFPASENMY